MTKVFGDQALQTVSINLFQSCLLLDTAQALNGKQATLWVNWVTTSAVLTGWNPSGEGLWPVDISPEEES